MAEYIDKNATVGILEAMSRSADCECIKKRLEKAAKRVSAIPAADVAPVVHGRWMHEETEGGFHIWRCGRCGKGMNDNPEGIDLYCYHCGAKMDGVE
jgi:hypothetical protein